MFLLKKMMPNMNVKDLKKKSGTDWERLANMADEEIDYSDIPPLDENFFKKGKLRMPEKRLITVPIDADILKWFKSQTGYETVINSVLRI